MQPLFRYDRIRKAMELCCLIVLSAEYNATLMALKHYFNAIKTPFKQYGVLSLQL